MYGSYPNGLFAFAYDAVALSSALAKSNPADLDAAITTPDGFVGINGVFRIFADGKNQHSLDVMEIRPQADIVVDQAPRKFTTFSENTDAIDTASLYAGNPPLIFGKDEEEAQRIIFGATLEPSVSSYPQENVSDNPMYHY